MELQLCVGRWQRNCRMGVAICKRCVPRRGPFSTLSWRGWSLWLRVCFTWVLRNRDWAVHGTRVSSQSQTMVVASSCSRSSMWRRMPRRGPFSMISFVCVSLWVWLCFARSIHTCTVDLPIVAQKSVQNDGCGVEWWPRKPNARSTSFPIALMPVACLAIPCAWIHTVLILLLGGGQHMMA